MNGDMKVLEVKFFQRGDESGTLHTVEFTSYEEYEEWALLMGASVEVFSDREKYV